MVARRHHYVPRCYLNSFALEIKGKKKRELLAFDALEQKPFRTSPDDVALQRDFNTIDLEGHAPDAFEKALAEVESAIGPALGRIVEQQSLANEDDRASLLNLICLLYVRNPKLREVMRSMKDQLAKVLFATALSNPKLWAAQAKSAKEAGFINPKADASYNEIKQSYKPDDYKLSVSNEEHILSEMNLFDHVLPQLFERKWLLLKVPENAEFVTCDHPVGLVWSGPRHPPRGLKVKGTEVIFPISPKLAVVGAFEIENGEATIREEQAAAFNGHTILNSERQVYATGDHFRYHIDGSCEPKSASELSTDKFFARTK